MARKPRTDKARGGPAARALKELREQAERNERGREAEARRRGDHSTIFAPPLTQRQMAIEGGFASTSSYQYNEDDCPKEYMTLTFVRQVMPSLVKRGIPEMEVMKRLLGTPGVRVVFPSPEAGRRVPVLARGAVGLIARGELDISTIGRMPAADLERWEADGVILGHEYLPGAGDGSVYFDLEDGSGRIAVDSRDRELVEGRSYVFCDLLNEFNFATWRGGGMVAAEGEARGREVPFDPEHDYVVGRAVYIARMEPL